MTADNRSNKLLTIILLGDIMLGRLIDQLLPTHVDEPEEAELVSHFRNRYDHLKEYDSASPWGNALSLFKQSDLVLGNLETSATTHSVKWPNKVFNYRMHPENVKCLTKAGIHYVSLANNHTLDFSKEGLLETVRTLKSAGIALAGAGETASQAKLPAQLTLQSGMHYSTEASMQHNVNVYSFSDHPRDWESIEQFNLLQYTTTYKNMLRDILTRNGSTHASLKIVSVHWGPNYSWRPDEQIRDMAHHFIDACGVDVVWGHSSHHIQGVEVYKGKLIIYGCGDFVDDYAVNQQYRNDLSAAWNLKIERAFGVDGQEHLVVKKLEIWPSRIMHFQVNILDKSTADHEWVERKFRELCLDLGTIVDAKLGNDGQIIVDLSAQSTEQAANVS